MSREYKENLALSLNDLLTIQPGQIVQVCAKLETEIEASLVKKHLYPNARNKVYFLNDFDSNSRIYNLFSDIEQGNLGTRIQYDDMNHVWYATVTLVKNASPNF